MQDPSTFDVLPPDWAAPLATEGFDKRAVADVRSIAYGTSSSPGVLPAVGNLFRAFHMTPIRDVRVVVVGKDPYPKSEDACGVAFSTPPGREPPPALRNIFKNLEDDSNIVFSRPATGDLTAWTKRGALLLNAALTLAPGSPSARFRLWRPFIESILRVVGREPRPIPVILLGSEANDLSGAIRDPDAVMAAGHPTPRGIKAARFPLFREATPFSDADTYLRHHGDAAFDWSLP